jgi:hypothetical protein
MRKFKNNTFDISKNENEKDNYSVSYRHFDEISNNKNQSYFDGFNNKMNSKNTESNKRNIYNYENQNEENLNLFEE